MAEWQQSIQVRAGALSRGIDIAQSVGSLVCSCTFRCINADPAWIHVHWLGAGAVDLCLDLSGGSDGAGPRSITKPLIIDFGDDGAGSVRLTIPESLEQVQAGPDGSTLNVTLSPDGRLI